jgi:alcohol dehydrogenase class IV
MMREILVNFPASVFIGQGAISRVEEIVSKYQRVLVLTYESADKNQAYRELKKIIEGMDLDFKEINNLPAEPTTYEAQEVFEQVDEWKPDLLIGFGGGSVIDIAKLISVMSKDTSVNNLIDDAGLAKKRIDTLIIPTTCGTGAEATPNSIVLIPEKDLKFGIVSGEMLPNYVILDPETIRELPQKLIAYTGTDALCHALECYTSNKANQLSDLFSLEAIRLIHDNLLESYKTDSMVARGNMLLASFYAGIAIASAGTTAVHALSYPLGGKYRIPHGLSNAILLVPVFEENFETIETELEEIYDYINPLDGKDSKAQWVLDWLRELLEEINIPSNLVEFNIGEEDLYYLAEAALSVQRLLRNNKKEYKLENIKRVYRKIM